MVDNLLTLVRKDCEFVRNSLYNFSLKEISEHANIRYVMMMKSWSKVLTETGNLKMHVLDEIEILMKSLE